MKRLFYWAVIATMILPQGAFAQTVAAGTPDLKVQSTNLTVSPSVIKDGASATFYAKIENVGTAGASNVKVRFYLGSVQMGEKTVSLSKGYYSTISQSFIIPRGTVGEMAYKVTADPDNAIVESDETNNEATKSVTVQSNVPDLSVIPESLKTTPVSFKGGDNVTFQAAVKNSGLASATNFKIKMLIGETLIAEKTITTLSPNAITYPSAMIAIPSDMAGAQTYKVIADSDGTVAENSEANNQAEKSVLIGAAASGSSVTPPVTPPVASVTSSIDLLPTSITFNNSSPKPGQSVTITARFKNQGTTDAKNVKLLLNANGVKITERTGVTMLAGREMVVTTSYAIPATMTGSLTVDAVADPQNTIAETDETNNHLSQTLVLTALNRDLAVSLADWRFDPVDKTVIAGRNFKVIGKVLNVGQDRAEATKLSINLIKYEKAKAATDKRAEAALQRLRLRQNKLKLSDKIAARKLREEEKKLKEMQTIRRVAVTLASVDVPSLSANGTYNINKVVALPADYAAYTAEIQIIANANSGVYEFNRGNNILTLTLNTQPKSFDAAIASSDVSHVPAGQLVRAGQSTYVKAKVTNQGTETLTNLKVKFYRNTVSSLQGATLVSTKSVGSLSAGGYGWVGDNITIPAGTTQNQIVIAVVDPDNALAEKDETNNAGYHTIPVDPQTRDLSMESLSANINNPKVGQTVTWHMRVKNYGNTAAGNVTVGIYTDLDSDQPTLTATFGSGIGPGVTVEKDLAWTVPANLPFAVNFPVRAVVDYNNQISETNEENNSKVFSLNIQAPDISISAGESRVIPATIYKGEYFNVYTKVRNSNFMATGPFKVGLYYYVIGQSSQNFTKLGEASVAGLAKNANQDLMLSAKLPDSIQVGTSVGLILLADSDQTVLESEEGNNRVEIARTVTDPPRRLQGRLLDIHVYDDNWEDLNGFTVALKDNATGQTETKTTGSENFYYSVGAVIFENRPASANYTVTISGPGFRTLTETWTFSDADYETRTREYHMDRRALITGRITDQAGQPISNASVFVNNTDKWARTNANGDYQIFVNGGIYSLRFVKPGYARIATASQSVPIAGTLTLNESMQTTGVGYVDGTITDDMSNPIAGVEVKNNNTVLGYTDAAGQFSFTLAGGQSKFKFHKTGFSDVEMDNYYLAAGDEQLIELTMQPPTTAGHAEKGASFVSWHQHEGTPANSFFVPTYNVDVWWGVGKVKMSMNYSENSNGAKVQNLNTYIQGSNWDCDKVEGEGEIGVSGITSGVIDVPIKISAGDCSAYMTKVDVYKVAVESDGQTVWQSDDYWGTDGSALNQGTKAFNLNNLNVSWNDDFKIKMWVAVQKKSLGSNEGEGSGALAGYHLDRKLITWYPKRPVTSSWTSTAGQIVDYFVGFLNNPVSAITSIPDLYSVDEVLNYTIEDVMPQDFPGGPPSD